MKLEEQVLNINQARHLQELGLDMSDSAFCFITRQGNEEFCVPFGFLFDCDKGKETHTYTLQEVLDKLPETIVVDKKRYARHIGYDFGENCDISYTYWDSILASSFRRSLLDTAYDMLCYLLENGYYKKNRE